MAEIDRVDVLYQSETVRIADVACRGDASPWSAEEISGGNGIVFLRAGLYVKRVANAEIVADANHAIFYNEREPYRVFHPRDGGDDCTEIGLSGGALAELLSPAVNERGAPFELTHCPCDSPTYFAQHSLLTLARRHGAAEALAIDERALAIADRVLQGARRWAGRPRPRRRPGTSRAHRESAFEVMKLLGARFHEQLALADVARTVHSSPFHLSRVFARETGMPIHRYQRALRLRAALERLDAGESNLTRLALDLGFASHAHFTEAFGREFGTPPSSVRANRRAGLHDAGRAGTERRRPSL